MFSTSTGSQKGSAFIYILVAVILLGGLSIAMSRQSSQSSHDITDERIILLVNEILQLASAAHSAVDNVLLAGSAIDNIKFISPGDTGFETDTIHNIYHPHGGGLEYRKLFSTEACVMDGTDEDACGIFVSRDVNIEGTPSTQKDITLYIHHLKQNVCSALNRRLTGDSAIPVLSGSLNTIFIGGGNLTASNCPSCADRPALCLQGSGSVYGFYSLLAPQ